MSHKIHNENKRLKENTQINKCTIKPIINSKLLMAEKLKKAKTTRRQISD